MHLTLTHFLSSTAHGDKFLIHVPNQPNVLALVRNKCVSYCPGINFYRYSIDGTRIYLEPTENLPSPSLMASLRYSQGGSGVLNSMELKIFIQTNHGSKRFIPSAVPVVGYPSSEVINFQVNETKNYSLDFNFGYQCLALKFIFSQSIVSKIHSLIPYYHRIFDHAACCWLINSYHMEKVQEICKFIEEQADLEYKVSFHRKKSSFLP